MLKDLIIHELHEFSRNAALLHFGEIKFELIREIHR